MDDWGRLPLGKAFEVQLGKMLGAGSEHGNQYHYLANRNVQWGRIVIDELGTMHFSAAEREQYRLQSGDLLVCEGGEVGRAALWSDELPDCYFQNAIHRLRATGIVDPRFMRHYFEFAAVAGLLRAMTGKTSIGHLPRSKLVSWHVPVPPVEEQRRIAEILDTIDETIQATERVIRKLAVSQSAFIDKSLYRSHSVPTELADVCWGPGEYGCVAAATEYRVGWPRYVRITDLTRHGDLRKGTEVGILPSAIRNHTLHTGDIVFARSGATVGKTYLYDPSDGPCAFAGYLIRFRPDPKRALPEYVRWWTHSSSYWRWVRQTMREGAQPNINAQEYAKAILPLPSVEEQRLIVDSIARFSVAIESERAHRRKLQEVRSGLAADLLSGRVRTVAA